MSKQDIRMVQEFNQWRRGGEDMRIDAGYPAQLGRALDSVVVMAQRYEKIRIINANQFAELHRRNIAGENFDDMVDAL